MMESSIVMESSTIDEESSVTASTSGGNDSQIFNCSIEQKADPQGTLSFGLKEDNRPCHVGLTDKHMGGTLKAIGQEMKTACLEWEQMMVESEQFELFCPTRVDKLLQEAHAMEEHLLRQKEELISRLRNLSQTLQVIS
ncbi:uncharacterized protein [Asterias amurensis]|uniref:uncharacterized protein n=1 Tax=Asterias amurensis TaxID=7602 RepID=UPI003AB28553